MANDFLQIIHKTFCLPENEIEWVEDSKCSRKTLVNVLNTLNGREVMVLVLRNVYGMTYIESTVEKVTKINGLKVYHDERRANFLISFFLEKRRISFKGSCNGALIYSHSAIANPLSILPPFVSN